MPGYKIYNENEPVITRILNSAEAAELVMRYYAPNAGSVRLKLIEKGSELKLVPVEPKAIEPEEVAGYARSFMVYCSAVEDMVSHYTQVDVDRIKRDNAWQVKQLSEGGLELNTGIISDDLNPEIYLPSDCPIQELEDLGFVFANVVDASGWVQARWPKGWSIKVQSRSRSVIYDEDNNPRIWLIFDERDKCVAEVIHG